MILVWVFIFAYLAFSLLYGQYHKVLANRSPFPSSEARADLPCKPVAARLAPDDRIARARLDLSQPDPEAHVPGHRLEKRA